MRTILELAGVHDVLGKSLGSAPVYDKSGASITAGPLPAAGAYTVTLQPRSPTTAGLSLCLSEVPLPSPG